MIMIIKYILSDGFDQTSRVACTVLCSCLRTVAIVGLTVAVSYVSSCLSTVGITGLTVMVSHVSSCLGTAGIVGLTVSAGTYAGGSVCRARLS